MQKKEQFMSSIRKIPGISTNLMEAVENGFSAVFEPDSNDKITGWISLRFPDASVMEEKNNVSSAAADLEHRFREFLDKNGFTTIASAHGSDGQLELDVEFPPSFVPDFMKSTPEYVETDSSENAASISKGNTEETTSEGQSGVTLTYLPSTGNPNVSTMGIDFSESIPNEEELLSMSQITVHIDNPRGPYTELAA